MADSKISALTDGSPLVATDDLVIARSGANYKIPASSIQEFLASDKKTITPGDITWTATTFTNISSSLDITITTGARRCLCVWTVIGTNTAATSPQMCIDVQIDGTLQGQTYGLVFAGTGGAGQNFNLSGSYVTAVLTAASHTFKLYGRKDGTTGTMTLRASTGLTPIVFSVVELAL